MNANFLILELGKKVKPTNCEISYSSDKDKAITEFEIKTDVISSILFDKDEIEIILDKVIKSNMFSKEHLQFF